MYQIVLTLVFNESGDRNTNHPVMTTTVLSFDTVVEANTAWREIDQGYPCDALYATAVRLY